MSVERQAYYMAKYAVGNREDALDIVQDTMLKLVQKYSSRPEAEWKCLFFKILQSKIRDWYRRNKVRNRWRTWFGKNLDSSDAEDGLAQYPDPNACLPEQAVENEKSMTHLKNAVEKLPLRQQQAFLLRTWEGLSVAETAHAMGCSQGSVKTHLSRATNVLRAALVRYNV